METGVLMTSGHQDGWTSPLTTVAEGSGWLTLTVASVRWGQPVVCTWGDLMPLNICKAVCFSISGLPLLASPSLNPIKCIKN